MLRPAGTRRLVHDCSATAVHIHSALYNLGEFDFRHNEREALGVDDTKRAEKAVIGIAGKRLTYRQPDQRTAGLPGGAGATA
jgi:hypothetical protein